MDVRGETAVEGQFETVLELLVLAQDGFNDLRVLVVARRILIHIYNITKSTIQSLKSIHNNPPSNMTSLLRQQMNELLQVQQAVSIDIRLLQDVFPDHFLDLNVPQNVFQFLLGNESVLVHIEVFKCLRHLVLRGLFLLLKGNHTKLVNIHFSRLVDIDLVQDLFDNFL